MDMLWLVGLALLLFVLISPWWALAEARRARRELALLRAHLDAIDRRLNRPAGEPDAEWTRMALLEPTAAVTLPDTGAPAAADEGSAAPPPFVAPTPPPVVAPPPVIPLRAAPEPEPLPSSSGGFDSSRVEELVGSVWLQNIGAVLLLLGVFFLILWGYTNGHIGPGVLVAAGVALGATVVWRGDRMARRLPLFGHALIGIGLGIAYLSLYLGHFTLHVLPPAWAFILLALLAIASVGVGLHYRVQTIAVLGVIGAFIPQLIAAWIPLHGFSMTPAGLLGYMAAIDAVVFVLAARAGWSGLSLAALLLTTITWVIGVQPGTWGWGIEAGLAATFTALGLSPVPWLVRRTEAIPPADLAVVTLAPFGLMACSWPQLAGADHIPVAIMLLVLAIVHLVVALWVDARRESQELWRPLTGAAIIFVSVALERMLGREQTPMAWCIEGTILLWIGLRPRGGWLRLCGSLVTTVGAVWMLVNMFDSGAWSVGDPPVFYGAGIRDLVCLFSVLAGGFLLSRARDQLSAAEEILPDFWTVAGHVLLAAWIGREAHHVAQSLETKFTDRAASRLLGLTFAITGAAWIAQALVLIETGIRGARVFLRACGHILAMVGALTIFLGGMDDGWSLDQAPLLHLSGVLKLVGIVALFILSARLARLRTGYGANKRGMPELWTVVAGLLMLSWTATEADHLARWMQGIPGKWAADQVRRDRDALLHVRMLTAAFTSAGWLIEAIALLVAGWMRSSAFLRWLGLGLFGVTVLKFLLIDLQTVDVFWRFLTALVVGAALLAVSYAYQRRTRARKRAS